MSSHDLEMRAAGKVPPRTIRKIRNVLRAHPGQVLRGSYPNGESRFDLIPAAAGARSRSRLGSRSRLALLRAKAEVASLHLAEDRLVQLKRDAATARRLIGG
jgi:hypothetical protein